jgi:hypothetical protein
MTLLWIRLTLFSRVLILKHQSVQSLFLKFQNSHFDILLLPLLECLPTLPMKLLEFLDLFGLAPRLTKR